MRKVPKLRFKEFSDKWEEKRLGDIFERITEKNTENNTNVLTISAQYGLISQTEFFNKSVAGKDLSKYYLLKKDDFAYNKSYSNGYPFGAIKKLNKYEKGIVSTLYICFRLKNRSNIVDFFEQFFESKKIDKNIQDIAQEGARNHGLLNINVQDFFDITKYTPSIQEQEKIANFLSSIDKKISLTEEKLELFREYKKGVMQKIFSQELRFKDNNGNDYPEWEEKRLGDILEEYNEKTTINNQYLTLSSTATGIYLQEEYFNRQIASTNNIGYKILKKDQLVFSPQNLWLGNININTKYDIGMVSPSYKIFNLKNNIILVNYFKNLIRTPKMLEEYKNASEQGASIVRRNLDMNQFNNIYIQLPCYEEQQKIADFLSSIDSKIESIEKELEGLKEFKRGLLQQMFV